MGLACISGLPLKQVQGTVRITLHTKKQGKNIEYRL